MAEKEERIERFITIQQRIITTRDYETNDEIISRIYPRQEAIEKMAKAMCHSPSGTCEDCFARESKKACKRAMFGMKELAEAALNALLEGK